MLNPIGIFFSLAVEKFGIRAGKLGKSCESRKKFGINCLELGQNILPYAVAGVGDVCVCAVGHEIKGVFAAECYDILFAASEYRSFHNAKAKLPCRRDTASTRGRATADKREKQSLRVVVGIVRGQKHGDVFFTHDLLKKGVSYVSCGFLKASARFLRQRGDVSVKNMKFYAIIRTELAAKFLVAVGFRASDAVVDVRGGEAVASHLKQMEEAYRIRAARKTEQIALPAVERKSDICHN